MAGSANTKYGWILAVYKKAEENSVTFLDQIEADIVAAQEGVSAGEIASVSGNGLTTSFSSTQLRPTQVLELIVGIHRLYSEAKANLDAREEEYDEANLAQSKQIRDEMMDLCHPVRRMGVDYSALRGVY